MRSGRLRTGAALATLLVAGGPLMAAAVAPPLTCGVPQTGRWETIPVRPFQPVSGLDSSDTVSAYALDARSPQHVVVTNGVRLQVSDSHGCDWRNGFALEAAPTPDQPFAGAASTIVSVGTSRGIVLGAVQEGEGALSRPHVVRRTGDSWTVADAGLPPQGAPRLLRMAGNGRTAYLTVSPTATGGSDSGLPGVVPDLPPLPALPLPGTGGGDTGTSGLLYGTDDGGATWTLRTDAASLPTGGQGFSHLHVDPERPTWLYGIAGGSLLVSVDGGVIFTEAAGKGYTALAPYLGAGLIAFTGEGRGVVTFDGGRTLLPVKAPSGITSVAARAGDSTVLVESHGVLRLLDPFSGTTTPVPATGRVRTGSLLGDHSHESSFHALSGHSLLRYVDPLPPGFRAPQIAVGDRSVPPPAPGTITPGQLDLRMEVGTRRTEKFALALPKNPTPLDLYFLVDVSVSMEDYIDNLKHNIHKVVDRLEAADIDLRVGVATMGTGPAEGEAPYPDYTAPTGSGGVTAYRKPRIYERIRAIGSTGADLRKAINSIQLETPPATRPGTYHEGQLLALEQMVTGSGLQTEQEEKAGLSTYSAVAPGQDAGWRENPDVRRIVVLASDEAFDVPYGTPQRRDSTVAAPLLDFTRTLRLLNEARVGVFGITTGTPDSVPDMVTLARGTRTFSPPGGVSCGGEPEQILPAGAPLVCSQDGDFSTIIGAVVARLTDFQDVQLRASADSPVLRSMGAASLRHLDVKQAHVSPFTLDLSCVDVDPGTYTFGVDALLRGYSVGRTRLQVTCAPLLAGPVVLPPVVVPPLAPALQPAPPPPAPPPAAQPQPQPQANVNPLAAAVTQEQQQAQLALALNNLDDDQQEAVEELAMVDRRERQQVQAFGSLLLAMTACAGLGLAALRTRHQVGVRVRRV